MIVDDDGNSTTAQRYPVVMIEERRVGRNDAIAAALTRSVGSMATLYVVLLIFTAWMGLATWGPLHRFDPYPFPFLLFLDNVVQLVLCLVILVGQRVLAAAADERAVRTYQNAEAIFHEVADLQAHLDRHDDALSRGVSLLESSPHPWIEQHRVQTPTQARGNTVGANHRIAAWLTLRLGSIWASYIAVGSQAAWVILAEAGVQRFDRYPFAFMSFLSTLAQLLFMIVIMVGQDVLGRANDRRSEQTFLDAEAILYECRRMKARLAAQDRVIDALTGYTNTHATEQLARAIHTDNTLSRYETQVAAAAASSTTTESGGSSWDELSEDARNSYRERARLVGEDLAAIGCFTVPAFDQGLAVVFTGEEVLTLARRDYERRCDEPADPSPGPERPGECPPGQWDRLSERDRALTLAAAKRIPVVLDRAGFQVLRDTTAARERPAEADFTPEQWQTLRHAMTACAVLTTLERGEVDAENLIELNKTVRDLSVTHPIRFVRELAAASTLGSAQNPNADCADYAEYEQRTRELIRNAVAIVARTAPACLTEFCALLREIAETAGTSYGPVQDPAAPPDPRRAITAVREAVGTHDTTTSRATRGVWN